MAILRLHPVRAVLVAAAVLVAGACGRTTPVTTPPLEAPPTDTVTLRYAAQPLVEAVELQLTHTSVGQYIEAELRLQAALELTIDADVLRSRWTVQGIDALTLTGTVAPNEHHEARGFLLARGKGITIGDVQGVVDPIPTDADAINAARLDSMTAEAPPAGVLLMAVLVEQLRLPRLPAKPLRVGEAVELEEESETVITGADAELVLPTTTVQRFTLRGLDEAVAEIAIQTVSIAEPEDDAPEVAARIEIRTEGTVLFDVARGAPVSLELSRTESFAVGEAEGERSVELHARFRSP